MYKKKKVVVVMPAYNAAQTIVKCVNEVLEEDIVDLVLVIDDASTDNTSDVANTLPEKVECYRHSKNKGYGANQKTCYALALEKGADIVIMVHPDYQYTPRLIPAMAALIGNDLYHCILGSRILGGYAFKSGMPLWKYISNRVLTFVENIILNAKLSEYHTGYRAFSRDLLQQLPIQANSDDFVFDNQMLAQVLWFGYIIAEVSCPTKYFPEASSINFKRSSVYGIGCLLTALQFRILKTLGFYTKRFPKRKRQSGTKQESPRF